MLPAELLAKYGNQGDYGTMLDWVSAGAKHPVWAYDAEAAAKAAGIARFTGIADADVDNEAMYRIANDPLDWGEQKKFNTQTGAEISRNKAWLDFVQDWTAQHPEAGNPVNTAPNVGDDSWLVGANAPSPWATDDTPGPGPDALPDQGYGSVNPGGQADPMTVSRLAQKDATNQRQLAQLLQAAIGKRGGTPVVKNPFALGRAFGGGAVNPFRR